MLVRLIALLLSLGMIVISTEAVCDFDTTTQAVLADSADDAPYEAAEPAIFRAPDAQVVSVPTLVSQPPSHRHEPSVFRPPRAALA